MGRIAGVTANETRERVLRGAATAFARGGYDGATIADIAAEAAVSSGAIYSHFGSKAHLFAAALHEHGLTEVERLLALRAGGTDVLGVLRERGLALPRRQREEGALLLEAIVAAKRHPHVATVLAAAITEREQQVAELIQAGQDEGSLARRLSPAAMTRFVSMLVFGSLVVAAVDLASVNDDEWATLIADLAASLTPD